MVKIYKLLTFLYKHVSINSVPSMHVFLQLHLLFYE